MYAALDLSSSSWLVDVNSPRPMPSSFEVKLPNVLKQYEAEKEEEERMLYVFCFYLVNITIVIWILLVIRLFFYPNDIHFTMSFSQWNAGHV